MSTPLSTPVAVDPDANTIPPTWWGGCCGCLLLLLSAALTVAGIVGLVKAVFWLWG